MTNRTTIEDSSLPVVQEPASGRRPPRGAWIRRTLVAAALATAAASAVVARPQTEVNWTIYGAGASPCKEWTAARKQGGGADTALRAWVAGFVSAAQYYHTLLGDTLAPLPAVPMDEQVKWLDARCAANPEEVVAVATRNMLTEFAERARRE
jgi:hypothetical protein